MQFTSLLTTVTVLFSLNAAAAPTVAPTESPAEPQIEVVGPASSCISFYVQRIGPYIACRTASSATSGPADPSPGTGVDDSATEAGSDGTAPGAVSGDAAEENIDNLVATEPVRKRDMDRDEYKTVMLNGERMDVFGDAVGRFGEKMVKSAMKKAKPSRGERGCYVFFVGNEGPYMSCTMSHPSGHWSC